MLSSAMKEQIYAVKERWLMAIFLVAGTVAFIAMSLPSHYGGGLESLEIDKGNYCLTNHNIKTEVSPNDIFWLFGWTGAGVVALVPCLIAGIMLIWKNPFSTLFCKQGLRK